MVTFSPPVVRLIRTLHELTPGMTVRKSKCCKDTLVAKQFVIIIPFHCRRQQKYDFGTD